MFLFHLLSSEDNIISRDILKCQVKSPKAGDWFITVQQDLRDIEISLTCDEISTFSKPRFKKLIKTACKNSCFKSLLRDKSKLSKGKEIDYSTFEMQNYFQPGHNLTNLSARRIFKVRSRDLPIKGNFPNQHDNITCPMPSCQERESQDHLWSCQFLDAGNKICQSGTEYLDIFGNDVRKQEIVMTIIFNRLEIRNKSCKNSAREPRGKKSDLHLVIREARRGSRRKKQDKRMKKLTRS